MRKNDDLCNREEEQGAHRDCRAGGIIVHCNTRIHNQLFHIA